jgi:secondary thiamine-phosphate synthase enzyme
MTSEVIRFTVQTGADTQFINITPRVRDLVSSGPVRNGLALVMTMHTTTGLTVNEGLEDLEDDLHEMLVRLVPADAAFRHARFLHSDGQMAVNAPSHLRGALLGMQVAAPIEDGALVLGSRQTIYLVELDGPLLRNMIVHVLGEA